MNIEGASAALQTAKASFSPLNFPRRLESRDTRAQVMALVRRSSRLPGMPDAFDRAPLQ